MTSKQQPKQPDYSSFYDSKGYLPQTDTAYTTLSIVKINPGEYVLRQSDIINGQVVKTQDSKPNARAVCIEYFKIAAVDLYYKER